MPMRWSKSGWGGAWVACALVAALGAACTRDRDPAAADDPAGAAGPVGSVTISGDDAAAERLTWHAPAVDLNLPDMTGVDILKIVKDNEHLRRAPVVILTTTDDQREIQRCYDLGCNVYITKPVNYEGFANAIRQLGLFFSVIQVPEAA